MIIGEICTDVTLERQPEFIDLVERLGYSENETIGFLMRFWWWASVYCPDGKLWAGNLKESFGTSKSPEEIIEILDECDFIRQDDADDANINDYIITDWNRLYIDTHMR